MFTLTRLIYIHKFHFQLVHSIDKVLRKHCEQYGSVLALRIFPEKGYAFVKYESHDIAAGAISVMNGQTLQGQIVKVNRDLLHV